MYKGKGQNHVSLYPDMFPRVFDHEIAYLASPNYHKCMSKKLRGINLVNIKVKVTRWRASDRKYCFFLKNGIFPKSVWPRDSS